MERRWLGYPLLALILLTAVFALANTASADRPEDCAPEDREILGNTTSPCKWDYRLNEITSVRYDVVEHTKGDSCYEVLAFGPYNGALHWPEEADLSNSNVWMAKKNEQGDVESGWGYSKEVSTRVLDSKPGTSISVIPGNPYRTVFYSADSIVPERPSWGAYDHHDYDVLKIYAQHSGGVNGINGASRWLPMPANIADFTLLMNDCLAGIKQRLDNEAKLEETRQRVEAERIAQERVAKEAAAEAERQRLETVAAREALRIVRETELAKTQALIEQLEREQIIIGIWQEIVDEKLAGAKARADITNTYLTEIEANAAEFKASVVAKAEEVRRLQEINDAIADAIIAHNDEIELQLAAQAEREAEQRKKLEDLHVEPPNETATPEPTVVLGS